jgi:hypothetical protein
VAGCGAIDDFVPAASASAERLWQQVENQLSAATDAAEAGTVFDSAEHVDVIKDAVALHFMRSVHLLFSHYRAAAQAWGLLRRFVVTRAGDLLRAHFLDVTGVHAAGPWALEAAFDDLARQRIDEMLDGLSFRSRVEQNVARMQDWLSTASLQLLRAPSPLYIGDAPVVLAAAGRTRHGLAGGLGLSGTEEILMPLTPRLAVRLSAASAGYSDIDEAEVDQLNVLQLANAYRYLYTAPSEPADAFIDANRAAWLRPPQIDTAKDTVRQLLRTLPRPCRTGP